MIERLGSRSAVLRLMPQFSPSRRFSHFGRSSVLRREINGDLRGKMSRMCERGSGGMAAGSRSPMVHLSANPNRRAASKSKLAIVFLCSIVLLGLATQFQLLKVPNYFANSSSTAASNQVPVVVGWGGVGLGENLTNIQTEIQALSQSGYNAVRFDFELTCTSV